MFPSNVRAVGAIIVVEFVDFWRPVVPVVRTDPRIDADEAEPYGVRIEPPIHQNKYRSQQGKRHAKTEEDFFGEPHLLFSEFEFDLEEDGNGNAACEQ